MAPEPNWLDTDEMRTWRALVRASNLLFERLNGELERAHGLSLGEYEILAFLADAPHGLRMSELADRALMSRSRMSHACDRLERRDLVKRVSDPTDGRSAVAVLTPAGRALLTEMAPTHVGGVRRYLIDRLDKSDQRALTEALEAVLAALGAPIEPPPGGWPGTAVSAPSSPPGAELLG
jgi:DNA-binding MarR family transcriptional regulator